MEHDFSSDMISTTTGRSPFCLRYRNYLRKLCIYTVQLFQYFTCNNLFHANQYGFRAEYSTELALSELVERILYIMVDSQDTSTFDILTHTSGKNRYINQILCSVDGAHRMLSGDPYFCLANSKIIDSVGEKPVILRGFCQSIP